MRYFLLVCDYDGTLALHGQVDKPTVDALDRVIATGRKCILVTGRRLDELLTIFPEIDRFEWVVAENGALLYHPKTRHEKLLCEPPSQELVNMLRARGVDSIAVGRAIIATWQPHEVTATKAIAELGLDLHVIFNKGAVMVLPTSVNKASGLKAVLKEMKQSAHNCVAVGDAENDHAMLHLCECGVAVANALPALKDRADFTTEGDHGWGVQELIDELLNEDLADREGTLARHQLAIGFRPDGMEVSLRPYNLSVLIAGPSGSGKSTAASTFLECLTAHRYQFCLIDPEGDYETFEGALILGNSKQGPSIEEVLQVLDNPSQNVVVNLIGLPIADRPPFFQKLLPNLLELRSRSGRPHWLVVDEAHHLLPADWSEHSLARALDRVLFITVHPNQVAPEVLAKIEAVFAVGPGPMRTLHEFCDVIGIPAPAPCKPADPNHVVLWRRGAREAPFAMRMNPPEVERRRHIRKYATGELSPESSFYFHGPEGKLNLRAQNLHIFVQLGEGVDDDTWLHHLRAHDYSRWFREKIKDDSLAGEAHEIEMMSGLSAKDSRKHIREAIERRYTLPASATSRENQPANFELAK